MALDRRISDMYGFVGVTDEAQHRLSELFSIEFENRDSSFLGDYYLYRGPGDESVRVRDNIDQIDGGPEYEKYAAFPVLVFWEGTLRADEIRRRIEAAHLGFVHLQRDAWD